MSSDEKQFSFFLTILKASKACTRYILTLPSVRCQPTFTTEDSLNTSNTNAFILYLLNARGPNNKVQLLFYFCTSPVLPNPRAAPHSRQNSFSPRNRVMRAVSEATSGGLSVSFRSRTISRGDLRSHLWWLGRGRGL